MKRIKYLLILSLLLTGMNSCYDEWLSVNPKTDITKPLMFNTESGIKDALTGAYIQMKSNSLYGLNLTMTTLEYMMTSWDVTTNTTEQRLGLFNYTDEGVANQHSAIFAAEYKTIASINAILDNLDANKQVISTPGLYELVKGECLGLRAYCHFDLLRMFGPVPSTPGTANVLPYVKTLSNAPALHIGFTQFRDELLADMAEAETLLKTVDPVVNYTLNELGRPGLSGSTFVPVDNFFAYRYFRMNYYAVKALQARAYLWFNQPQEAYKAAKVVLDAKNADGNLKFRPGTSADLSSGDYALTVEQVFALYDFQLYTKYNDYFVSGNTQKSITLLKKGSAETTIKTTLYGNTGTDIREANLWELVTQPNQAKTYLLKKYKCVETPSTHQVDYKRIPLIRISELYLIAAETAPAAEAQQYWATFRTNRNITVTTLPVDPAQLQLELAKEYRKEFYGEGQAFFAYKRMNIQKPNFIFLPTAVTTVNYVFPLPKTEIISTK